MKELGESLILIGHNLRQVFNLVAGIDGFRRDQLVVVFITCVKTGAEFEDSV